MIVSVVRFLMIALFFLPAIGCATEKYTCSVNAIASTDSLPSKTYVILSGTEGVRVDDLQFMEFARYVDRALQMRGYMKVRDLRDAGYAIFLSYFIGDPQTHVSTYLIPHIGQTGIASSSSVGTLYNFGNYGVYSGTTTYQPSYGISGYSTGLRTTTTYTHVMSLAAVDVNYFRTTNQIRNPWLLAVASTGPSPDLRRIFPVMIAAAQPYVGRNSGGKIVDVALADGDEAVVAIRDGINRP